MTPPSPYASAFAPGQRLELRVDGDVVLESSDHGMVARQAARYAAYSSVAIVRLRRS